MQATRTQEIGQTVDATDLDARHTVDGTITANGQRALRVAMVSVTAPCLEHATKERGLVECRTALVSKPTQTTVSRPTSICVSVRDLLMPEHQNAFKKCYSEPDASVRSTVERLTPF